jgi:hypothetical protein
LDRYVEAAAIRIGARVAILVVIDSDGEPPCVMGPDTPVGIALAQCEWENWHLAAADSLAGCSVLLQDIASPEHPESIQGAKE